MNDKQVKHKMCIECGGEMHWDKYAIKLSWGDGPKYVNVKDGWQCINCPAFLLECKEAREILDEARRVAVKAWGEGKR